MRKSARFQYTREGVTCFIDIVADQVSAVEEGTDGYRKWCTLSYDLEPITSTWGRDDIGPQLPTASFIFWW